MRLFCKTFLLLLLTVTVCGQENQADSLKHVFRNSADDSIRYESGRQLYLLYEERNRDSALYYADQCLQLARKHNKKLAEVVALDIKGYQLLHHGQYAAAFQNFLQAFKIAEDPGNDMEESWLLSHYPSPGHSRLLALSLTHHMFSILMEQTQNVQRRIFHLNEARRIALEIGNKNRYLLAIMNLGNSYLTINKPDSALVYTLEAEKLSAEGKLNNFRGHILANLGDIALQKGDRAQAKKYYDEGLNISTQLNTFSSIVRINARLLQFHKKEGNKDSVLYYALKNIETVRAMGAIASVSGNIGIAYEQLYQGYELNGRHDSAYKYAALALVTKDSLANNRIRSLAEFQSLSFSEQRRLQEMENDKVAYQNRIRTYFLLAGIAVLLLLAIIFYRNNRQKHKAKVKIEQAYHNLKATQQQLIQAEKMASLGELTAGIAHEIQNPLNFVNNFSEVSNELINEMVEEVDKGNTGEVKVIAKDVQQNLEKILHHGKRADSIVKGMLQHSRSTNGQKELTDINALADEYLRLAYHGLRAKDKSFNANFKIDLDPGLPRIKIIPQDIGRVFLNLINNAFYAVNNKKQHELPTGNGTDRDDPPVPGYEPIVSVSTKRVNGKIEIRVNDNGTGIPQTVLDKVFQPFFTTKPAGQGTGLGLSLSYDIVKAHGGDLKVETKEGEGSAFIIQLPTN